MQKESEIKDINAFKQLKPLESTSYLFRTILKFEISLKKDTLLSYMSDLPDYNQQKYGQIIDTAAKSDISEEDFKKIIKNLALKTADINTIYERLLRKQKLSNESPEKRQSENMKPSEKWAKVFDKIDLDKSGSIELTELLKYFQTRKIDTAAFPRKELADSFAKMEADKSSKGVTKEKFINFCLGNCSRAFYDIVNKIAENEGYNKKVETDALQESLSVNEQIKAMNLSPEKIQQFTACFDLLDISRDGNFTKNNFDTFLHLKHMQTFFTSEEKSKIFKDMEGDTDNYNYKVDKAEFFRYLAGIKCDPKFLKFLDTIFVNYIQVEEKVIETEDQFKERMQLDDTGFTRLGNLYDLLDTEGTGNLKLKSILPFLKKHGIELSAAEGNKIFKEMNTDGDDSVSKQEFIEYLLKKPNSNFKNIIDNIEKKEGGKEEVAKKLMMRKNRRTDSRKSINLSSGGSIDLGKGHAKKLSITDPNGPKIDMFFKAVDTANQKSFGKTELDNFLKNNKLVSLFAKNDMNELFKEGGDKVKKDFITKYYNKNKKFKALVDTFSKTAMDNFSKTLTGEKVESMASVDVEEVDIQPEVNISDPDIQIEDTERDQSIVAAAAVEDGETQDDIQYEENPELGNILQEADKNLEESDEDEPKVCPECAKRKELESQMIEIQEKNAQTLEELQNYIRSLEEGMSEMKAKMESLELENLNLSQVKDNLEENLIENQEKMNQLFKNLSEKTDENLIINQRLSDLVEKNSQFEKDLSILHKKNQDLIHENEKYYKSQTDLLESIKKLEHENQNTKESNINQKLESEILVNSLKLQLDEMKKQHETLGMSKNEDDKLIKLQLSEKDALILSLQEKLIKSQAELDRSNLNNNNLINRITILEDEKKSQNSQLDELKSSKAISEEKLNNLESSIISAQNSHEKALKEKENIIEHLKLTNSELFKDKENLNMSIANLNNDLHKAQEESKKQNSSLSENQEKSSKEILDIKEKLKKFEYENEELKKYNKKLEKDIHESMELANKKLQDKENNIIFLQGEINSKNLDIEKLISDKQGIQADLILKENELKGREDSLNHLEESNINLKSKLEVLEAKLTQEKETSEKNQLDFENLKIEKESEILKLSSSVNDLKLESKSYGNENKILIEELQKLKDLNQEILSKSQSQTHHLSEELLKLKSELESEKSHNQTLGKSKEDADQTLRKLLDEKESQITELNSKILYNDEIVESIDLKNKELNLSLTGKDKELESLRYQLNLIENEKNGLIQNSHEKNSQLETLIHQQENQIKSQNEKLENLSRLNDQLETEIKNLRSHVKLIEDKSAENELTLNKEISDYKQKLNELLEKLRHLEIKNEDLKKDHLDEISKLKSKNDDQLREAHQELENFQKEHELKSKSLNDSNFALGRSNEDLKAKLDVAKAEIQKMHEESKLNQDSLTQKLEENNTNLQNELKIKVEFTIKLEVQINELKQQVSDLTKKLKDALDLLNEKEKEDAAFRAEKLNLISDYEGKLNQKEAENMKISDELKIKNNEFESLILGTSKREDEISNLKSELESKENEFLRINTELLMTSQSLRDTKDQELSLKNQIDSQSNELSKHFLKSGQIEEENKNLVSQIKKLKDEMEAQKHEHEELSKKLILAKQNEDMVTSKLNAELSFKNDELHKLKLELSETRNLSESKVVEKNSEIEELNLKLKLANNELGLLKSQSSANKSGQDEIEKMISELKKSLQEKELELKSVRVENQNHINEARLIKAKNEDMIESLKLKVNDKEAELLTLSQSLKSSQDVQKLSQSKVESITSSYKKDLEIRDDEIIKLKNANNESQNKQLDYEYKIANLESKLKEKENLFNSEQMSSKSINEQQLKELNSKQKILDDENQRIKNEKLSELKKKDEELQALKQKLQNYEDEIYRLKTSKAGQSPEKKNPNDDNLLNDLKAKLQSQNQEIEKLKNEKSLMMSSKNFKSENNPSLANLEMSPSMDESMIDDTMSSSKLKLNKPKPKKNFSSLILGSRVRFSFTSNN